MECNIAFPPKSFAFWGLVAVWLAGWLASWLPGWPAGWLAGWLAGWMASWSFLKGPRQNFIPDSALSIVAQSRTFQNKRK